MELPISETRRIYRFQGDTITELDDEIVTEYALTVFVNEEELATLVCTPTDLEELTTGFLASEGIVRRADQIVAITIDERQGFAYVETNGTPAINQQFYNKRYIASCCGKGRQSFYYFNDARTAQPVTSDTVLSAADAGRLMRLMQTSSSTFHETGGVHNAALCDAGGIVAVRTDVGRHNALDKLYGYCLRGGIALHDKAIAFSGRISSEIVLKAAKIGVGIILSKSAPTMLALQMADELGITAVGFIRGDKLNVYSHPQRIAELAQRTAPAAPGPAAESTPPAPPE
ncbi:MAG: formate dehydrogenase accessory sulfurtransferase FdhD [Paenibacillaceae bacterium]|nr:formate dehydrogenase accessory sulfurtransferase FdhD [Paenibacillaceae bacterium]